MTPTERAVAVFERLDPLYPEKKPLLEYSSPFELLIAVILSAQTTDSQVNRVTPELFRRFPTPDALAAAEPAEIESIIFSTGFYRAKARNIRAAAKALVEEYGGELPCGMDELTGMPGVGRKTANVVLGVLCGRPSIVVDTHFGRVVRRIGLTAAAQPSRVERELVAIVPPDIRTDLSMTLNFHGRYVCTARKPACYRCPVSDLCLFEGKTPAPAAGDIP
ncbi:MAG: endonuclease III [Spirochaetaceae bacterium]